MTTYLWILMIFYGIAMFLISPRSKQFSQFFQARSQSGKEIGIGLLIGSVVISWIFAKSITNSANLGQKFGFVGTVAYAGWYLSIPIAGVVIYGIRKKLNSTSLSEFLLIKHGRFAALAFVLVIFFRLMNEVWSNTAVVGSYFGASSTGPYFLAAIVFTILTLAYSLRGGLRSSVLTDGIQFMLFIFFISFLLFFLFPRQSPSELIRSGSWTMAGGIDLLLVGILQSFSYPFHDPVLTDRAFLTKPRAMLLGYLLAGLIAGLFIILFGLVGVFASLEGVATGQDTPVAVAQIFGSVVLIIMSGLMMISAGSTLDSTLSSFSRVGVSDLGGYREASKPLPLVEIIAGKLKSSDPVKVGKFLMLLLVIIGSVPLFAGAAILKATTVSGTMVIGLAPIFLFYAWKKPGPIAFHLALWPGVFVGILYASGSVPNSWNIGSGSYASLLGANLIGSVMVTAGFLIGTILDQSGLSRRKTFAAVIMLFMISAPTVWPDESPLTLSGQTMLRTTVKTKDWENPGLSIYNIRLKLKKELDQWAFVAEPRFRQSKLRSFSPSNVWLQQAHLTWTSPLPGLQMSAGLLYNQLGLFWDGSWFGNLPYLYGHKLDPDPNFQIHYFPVKEKALGIEAWLQYSPNPDGTNGTFVTDGIKALSTGPVDPETSTGFSETASYRARLLPSLSMGNWVVSPGFSLQYSEMETPDTSIAENVTGQTVVGADLTVEVGKAKLFGEWVGESFSSGLKRNFILAGLQAPVWSPKKKGFQSLSAGLSTQIFDSGDEGFSQGFATARLQAEFNSMVGTTLEYVRWWLDDFSQTELNRFEWIIHVYY